MAAVLTDLTTMVDSLGSFSFMKERTRAMVRWERLKRDHRQPSFPPHYPVPALLRRILKEVRCRAEWGMGPETGARRCLLHVNHRGRHDFWGHN